MAVYTRADSGLVKAKRITKLPNVPAPEWWQHHGGDRGAPPATLDEAMARWRSYQRYHMRSRLLGGRGWTDIAYNFGVTQSGDILVGRGWTRQGGATGSPWDARSISCCAVGNFETHKPTDELLDAIVDLAVWGIEANHLVPLGELGEFVHKDNGSGTQCCGQHLIAAMPEVWDNVDRRLNPTDPAPNPPTLEQRVAALEQAVFS